MSQKQDEENPYLSMGFWEFAIMSTLMVVFFPWSLLFCVVVYGLSGTKLIVQAIVYDAVKTILAVLSFIVSLVVIVGLIVFIFSIFGN